MPTAIGSPPAARTAASSEYEFEDTMRRPASTSPNSSKRHELVAGGEDGDARAPMDDGSRTADGGEHADVRGTEGGARARDDRAGAHVLTRGAHVRARVAVVADLDHVRRRGRILHAHHAVRALVAAARRS